MFTPPRDTASQKLCLGNGGAEERKITMTGNVPVRAMLILFPSHLAIASSMGHVATFDWQAGKLHSEIQLRETIRDIK